MKNNKPTLEEFCQIYPELLAQAREYAEGARTAMFYKEGLQVHS